jgi:hypothetical protein
MYLTNRFFWFAGALIALFRDLLSAGLALPFGTDRIRSR